MGIVLFIYKYVEIILWDHFILCKHYELIEHGAYLTLKTNNQNTDESFENKKN